MNQESRKAGRRECGVRYHRRHSLPIFSCFPNSFRMAEIRGAVERGAKKNGNGACEYGKHAILSRL
jgi:hypothetical protein